LPWAIVGCSLRERRCRDRDPCALVGKMPIETQDDSVFFE
jgi:hypothetical protein